MATAKSSAKKEPFRIFEAGPGILARDLIGKAAKNEKQGKNREFVGVDKSIFPRIALLLSGRRRMPSNLKLERGNAISKLSSMKSRSQNVVFESYLLNNISEKECDRFIRNAKRVLKHGAGLSWSRTWAALFL
jgi:hypothetical protein